MVKRLNIKRDDRFNSLTIIKEVNKINNKRSFLCRCDCGRKIIKQLVYLKNGDTKSCGCKQKEKLIKRNYRYNGGYHKNYTSWKEMLNRCYNIKSISYYNYGQRDIFVCRRWRKDFWNFVKDMNDKPSKEYSIDRIDNNGPYGSWNCKWSTNQEQALNRRTNVHIQYKGKTKTISEWSKIFKININTLSQRLIKNDYNMHKALKSPFQKQKKRFFTINNIKCSLKELSKKYNINYNTLYDRLYKQNKTIKESLNLG